MQDVSLLLEALPFLNLYKGKTFVMKVGGEVVQEDENRHSLTRDIALLNTVGIRTLIIHGGGPQASELSERLGLKPVFFAGRRITDSATLEVATMVFAGKINTEILSSLRRWGARAVGLSGVDANLVSAKRRAAKPVLNPETGQQELVDFGHVGDILKVDVSVLNTLMDNGYVPVLSSLGADEDGNVYNINADTVAAEIAAALEAEKLLILSNVPGVLAQDKTVVPRLTAGSARQLMENGTVTKGMVPKLTAAVRAVELGVGKATILSGLMPHSLLEETFTDRGSGTLIEAGPPERKKAKSPTKRRTAARRTRR
jgi:acetylglutamate kinase